MFIIGGIEVLYKEGTTQGYPIAMATYPLGVTQLIQHLLEMTPFNKQLAYAEDFTVAGSIKDIICCWEHLNLFEHVFWLPHTKKSILIKSKCCLPKH